MERKWLVPIKSAFGLMLIMLAFNYPSILMGTLIITFFLLYAMNFLLNSSHYMVWRNGKPNFISIQRVDRAPKYVIPDNSLLGQVLRFVGHALLYGLVALFLVGMTIMTGIYVYDHFIK